jgi:DNA repair exonuclease SbcCD ATPase subunit
MATPGPSAAEDAPSLEALSSELDGLCTSWQQRSDSGSEEQMQLANLTQAAAEREALRSTLCDALAEGIGDVHFELAGVRAALERTEQERNALQHTTQQAQALANGARMKAAKLATDMQREVERAEVAEAALEAMQERAEAAEAAGADRANALAAARASDRTADVLQLEAEREKLRERLATANRTCKQANEECERVRRRNEQLERELEALRELLQSRTGATKVDSVLDDLAAMERLVNRSAAAGLHDATDALEFGAELARQKQGDGVRRRTSAADEG